MDMFFPDDNDFVSSAHNNAMHRVMCNIINLIISRVNKSYD